MRYLAYVEWGASGVATPGTWTTTNLLMVQHIGPGIRMPGDMVQFLTSYPTPAASTSSTSFIYSGAGLALTPTSAANIMRIQFGATATKSGANDGIQSQISRGVVNNTNLIGNEARLYDNGSGATACFLVNIAYDIPNTSSSQAYGLQIYSMTGLQAGTYGAFTCVFEGQEIFS